jgi:hypothetical protein
MSSGAMPLTTAIHKTFQLGSFTLPATLRRYRTVHMLRNKIIVGTALGNTDYALSSGNLLTSGFPPIRSLLGAFLVSPRAIVETSSAKQGHPSCVICSIRLDNDMLYLFLEVYEGISVAFSVPGVSVP